MASVPVEIWTYFVQFSGDDGVILWLHSWYYADRSVYAFYRHTVHFRHRKKNWCRFLWLNCAAILWVCLQVFFNTIYFCFRLDFNNDHCFIDISILSVWCTRLAHTVAYSIVVLGCCSKSLPVITAVVWKLHTWCKTACFQTKNECTEWYEVLYSPDCACVLKCDGITMSSRLSCSLQTNLSYKTHRSNPVAETWSCCSGV